MESCKCRFRLKKCRWVYYWRIIGRGSVFFGAETSAYPQNTAGARRADAIGLCKLQLLRYADTASIYSVWHLVFFQARVQLGMPAYMDLAHLTCLPPEQWMNSSNSNCCRSSSRHSDVAEVPVHGPTAGHAAIARVLRGKCANQGPACPASSGVPVSCGLCRCDHDWPPPLSRRYLY